MKFYFAFLILSSLAASALSGGVEVTECSGKKAGCVPTGWLSYAL